MSKIRVGPARRETSEETRAREFFDAQERKNLDTLEAGARQIITLVSAFYGVLLGTLALGREQMEAGLRLKPIVWAGGTAVGAWLVAILAALVVVLPLWEYSADPRRPTEQLAAYRRMRTRKKWGLRVAFAAFGLGMMALAGFLGGLLACR
jgi:hypothetical protein